MSGYDGLDAMISDPNTANEINALLLDVYRDLYASLRRMKPHMTRAEFEVYAGGVGHVISDLTLDILDQIYKLHPALKPEGMY